MTKRSEAARVRYENFRIRIQNDGAGPVTLGSLTLAPGEIGTMPLPEFDRCRAERIRSGVGMSAIRIMPGQRTLPPLPAFAAGAAISEDGRK